ncbi:hypothetical protein E3Q15_01276 [Wallemia mellicola]|nr:hypothetical protein E3Q15_01276 [Wallemia mellicola]
MFITFRSDDQDVSKNNNIRSIDEISYADTLYALVIQPLRQYFISLWNFITWTPKVNDNTSNQLDESIEPLLGNQSDCDDHDISPPSENKPVVKTAEQRRLEQFEAYLAEKKRRKAAKKFRRMLETTTTLSESGNERKHSKNIRGPPTDVGSIASSSFSGMSASTISPHEADYNSAFSLTQDDLLFLKQHDQSDLVRTTKEDI